MNKAKAYQKEHEKIRIFEIFFNPAILILTIAVGISGLFKSQALAAFSNPYGVLAVYFSLFSLWMLVFDLPLAFYSGYVLEKKYELSNHTLTSWLGDLAKRSLLSFVFSLALIEALYALIWHFPQNWWVLAWAGFTAVSYGMGKLFPVFIVPMFYKYGKVEDETLKKRIVDLAARYGMPLENVYSLNLSRTTKKANAAFMGMGKTKRVVLSDTLLEKFNHDEIETVVAHELGHFKHGDIWKQLGVGALSSLLGFWVLGLTLEPLARTSGFEGISDIAALPVLFLIFYLFFLILKPLQNGFSRSIERAADRFALTAFPKPEAFISCMDKLGTVNLADPEPHPLVEWFFYDHPAIGKRIQMAKTWKAAAVILLMLTLSPALKAEDQKKSAAAQALERRQEVELRAYFVSDPNSSKMPGTPMAIELFNQAVGYYEKSDFELAKQALKESIRYDPQNVLAYELLGDIFNNQQDLKNAKENYEMAYNLRPSSSLKTKLEKLTTEAKVDRNLSTTREEHFIIKYHDQDRTVEGFELRELLRKIYRQVSSDFGFYFKNQVVVLLYDEADFKKITNLPHWVGGAYDGKVRMPINRQGFTEKDLNAVIAHEVTHAFVAGMSQNRAPAWINEGLAQYEENKLRALDPMVFDAAVKTKTLMPLDQLMNPQHLEAQTDPLWMALFYKQSFHLTSYLVTRYGLYRVKLMLQEFAKGKGSNEAVEAILRIPVSRLEKEWRATFTK